MELVKKTFWILAAISLQALPAMASPSFNFGMFTETPTPKPSDSPMCADFSGTWKGVCVADGSETPKQDFSLTIEQQGCGQISVEKFFPFAVGGLTTYSQSNETSSVTQTITADWNADRTVMNGKNAFVWRPRTRQEGPVSSMSQFIGTQNVSFKLINQQLVIEVSGEVTDSDSVSHERFHAICHLDKK